MTYFCCICGPQCPGQALGAVLEEALTVLGAVTQYTSVQHYLLDSSICLLSNYSLSIYYVLCPRDDHKQGSDLLCLYIAHISRVP